MLTKLTKLLRKRTKEIKQVCVFQLVIEFLFIVFVFVQLIIFQTFLEIPRNLFPPQNFKPYDSVSFAYVIRTTPEAYVTKIKHVLLLSRPVMSSYTA